MITITPENFISGMLLQNADEVTMDDGRQFVCKAVNQLWNLMDIVSNTYYTQLKETRQAYTIIHGPDHGQTLDTPTIVEEGQTVIIHTPAPFRKGLPDNIPVRYSHPLFMRRYHILGDYAYYIGEEIFISSVVEEADKVLGPIAAKMNAESEGSVDAPN